MLVIVGVDGREESLHAARSAAVLFPHAKYIAVNVIEPPLTVAAYGAAGAMGPAPIWPVPYPGDAPPSPRQALLPDLLEDVEQRQEYGDAARALLDVAEERQADLIVIGSHHRGLLGRLFHRSTTQALIHTSDIPILVVPL